MEGRRAEAVLTNKNSFNQVPGHGVIGNHCERTTEIVLCSSLLAKPNCGDEEILYIVVQVYIP